MGDFDVTAKHLIRGGPRDWLTLAGLPAVADPAAVTAVDPDLSTVAKIADKLLRVDGPAGPYVAHIEFQSGADVRLDDRVLLYNVLVRWHYELPARSVVFLLRPAAVTKSLVGGVHDQVDAHARLAFDYRMVRVWQLPVETVLAGGLGTLPLAPVTAVAPADVPAVIERMRHRLAAEAPPAAARESWVMTRVLLGLRFDGAVARSLLQGVLDMEESTTFQEIVEIGVQRGVVKGRIEGRVEGLVEGERAILVRIGTRKFGPPGPAVLARLAAITVPEELDRLAERLQDASSWDDLLGA